MVRLHARTFTQIASIEPSLRDGTAIGRSRGMVTRSARLSRTKHRRARTGKNACALLRGNAARLRRASHRYGRLAAVSPRNRAALRLWIPTGSTATAPSPPMRPEWLGRAVEFDRTHMFREGRWQLYGDGGATPSLLRVDPERYDAANPADSAAGRLDPTIQTEGPVAQALSVFSSGCFLREPPGLSARGRQYSARCPAAISEG